MLKSVKESFETIVTTLLTFVVLGPPIGAIVLMTMMTIILPLPGPLGFGDSKPLPEFVINYIGFLFIIAIPGSYIFCSKFALFCGAVVSVAKIAKLRVAFQISAAIVSGLVAASLSGWNELRNWNSDYYARSAIDVILTCVVPSFCCAWLIRTREDGVHQVCDPSRSDPTHDQQA